MWFFLIPHKFSYWQILRTNPGHCSCCLEKCTQTSSASSTMWWWCNSSVRGSIRLKGHLMPLLGRSPPWWWCIPGRSVNRTTALGVNLEKILIKRSDVNYCRRNWTKINREEGSGPEWGRSLKKKLKKKLNGRKRTGSDNVLWNSRWHILNDVNGIDKKSWGEGVEWEKNMTDKRTKKAEKIYVKRPYVSQLSEGGLGREEDDAAAATCNMR